MVYLDTVVVFPDNTSILDTIKAEAFSPSHITGFFAIKDSHVPVLQKGSLGAGVSLHTGVRTKVEIHTSDKKQVKIRLNGQITESAIVSERVIDIFLRKTGLSPTGLISIDHFFSVPMGCGLGTSGAGALSLSYALNKVFQTGLPFIKAAQIAHQAEVEMKTGLGTVIGETFGGIEIRVKPGGPGIGKIIHIRPNGPHKVIALIFRPLSTSTFLQNQDMRKKINQSGRTLIKKIIKEQTLANFLQFSQQFSYKTGLITKEVSPIVEAGNSSGYTFSMPIFGNGVFTIVESQKAGEVVSFLEKYSSNNKIIVTEIDSKGALVINGN